MTASTATGTDKGMGLALAFSALAFLGAIGMAVAAPEGTAGWGFAAALLFGSLAIVGIHLYWESP